MTEQPHPQQPGSPDQDLPTVIQPSEAGQPSAAASQPPPPQAYQAYPPAAASAEATQPAYALAPAGPLGKIRGTGMCILLFLVTLGIYGLYWYYAVHRDMKEHSGRGIGGVVALIIAFFVGIVMPFITSSEIGDLYGAQGQARPVSGATGLWYFPGMFILIGPIVWFVKTNDAINSYWRQLGAQG